MKTVKNPMALRFERERERVFCYSNYVDHNSADSIDIATLNF